MLISDEGSNYTYNEILKQQLIWEKVLDSLAKDKSKLYAYLDKYKNHKWIFTGCGTSYYLAQTGSYILKISQELKHQQFLLQKLLYFRKILLI